MEVNRYPRALYYGDACIRLRKAGFTVWDDGTFLNASAGHGTYGFPKLNGAYDADAIDAAISIYLRNRPPASVTAPNVIPIRSTAVRLDNSPTGFMWHGKPIEQCTKAELIKCIGSLFPLARRN